MDHLADFLAKIRTHSGFLFGYIENIKSLDVAAGNLDAKMSDANSPLATEIATENWRSQANELYENAQEIILSGNNISCLNLWSRYSSSKHAWVLTQQINQNLETAPHFGSVQLQAFSYEVLQKATGSFSHDNCIGRGGSGEVYGGNISNKQVAIKKLFAGENATTANQLATEVAAISRTNHPNLVKLLGYHIDQANKLLVFEFISNKSLQFHLHGERSTSINWRNRMKIALGSAKGLEYLHDRCQPGIIHRDIKPENILLCDDFRPKIGDFGLARDIPQSTSHVSTDPKGTFGYFAPEYFRDRRLTKKSDVFAFGMILLELITGRKSVFFERDEHHNLAVRVVLEIKNSLEKKNYKSLVDPNLGDGYLEKEMYRMINCAAACVYKPEKERPDMSEIVKALQGHVQLEVIWRHRKHRNYLYPGAPHSSSPPIRKFKDRLA